MRLPRAYPAPARALLVTGLAAGAVALGSTPSSAATRTWSCGFPAHTRATPTLSSERAVLCAVNHVRVMHGLRRLHFSWSLTRTASHHSSDMVARGYFSHTTPAHTGLMGRAIDSGYARRARVYALGETLAWAGDGLATPTGLVAVLMASPPHRAILLDPGYQDIGVGIRDGSPGEGGGGATLTLDLGARRFR